jgi:hypothetical protein
MVRGWRSIKRRKLERQRLGVWLVAGQTRLSRLYALHKCSYSTRALHTLQGWSESSRIVHISFLDMPIVYPERLSLKPCTSGHFWQQKLVDS